MSAGYNAVGISQGGLLIRNVVCHHRQPQTRLTIISLFRGLVQRCPVPVHNLITFGAPHQVGNNPLYQGK